MHSFSVGNGSVAVAIVSYYDWEGLVPFDSLPYSYNPEKGYVRSANQRTVNEAFPHYISAWFSLEYRAKRIDQMLTEKELLSVVKIISTKKRGLKSPQKFYFFAAAKVV